MSAVTIPCTPDRLVSANVRVHWARRAALQRWWRTQAGWAARTVPDLDFTPPVLVVATVRYPDRRHRDAANLYPLVVKPALDGLVDAGWLVDDDDTHVAGVTIRRDPERGPHRLVIEVSEA